MGKKLLNHESVKPGLEEDLLSWSPYHLLNWSRPLPASTKCNTRLFLQTALPEDWNALSHFTLLKMGMQNASEAGHWAVQLLPLCLGDAQHHKHAGTPRPTMGNFAMDWPHP